MFGRRRHTTSKNSARDGDTSGRPTQGGNPMGSTNTTHGHRLMEVTNAELVEAAERMDNGRRLALHAERDLMAIAEPPASPGMEFDGLGADPEPRPKPEIDDTVIGRAADKVAAFREEAAAELKHLDKHTPRYLHVEALALVAQCDEFLGAVRAYFRDGQS